jgi:hypothetical protein
MSRRNDCKDDSQTWAQGGVREVCWDHCPNFSLGNDCKGDSQMWLGPHTGGSLTCVVPAWVMALGGTDCNSDPMYLAAAAAVPDNDDATPSVPPPNTPRPTPWGVHEEIAMDRALQLMPCHDKTGPEGDPWCQRRAGHPGPHYSRGYDWKGSFW